MHTLLKPKYQSHTLSIYATATKCSQGFISICVAIFCETKVANMVGKQLLFAKQTELPKNEQMCQLCAKLILSVSTTVSTNCQCFEDLVQGVQRLARLGGPTLYFKDCFCLVFKIFLLPIKVLATEQTRNMYLKEFCYIISSPLQECEKVMQPLQLKKK